MTYTRPKYRPMCDHTLADVLYQEALTRNRWGWLGPLAMMCGYGAAMALLIAEWLR